MWKPCADDISFFKTNDYGDYTGDRRSITKLKDILKDLTVCETIENWECEIQDVEGLSGSKAFRYKPDFFSCDEMAENCCKDFIQPLNKENLLKNLNWHGIRIRNWENGGGAFFVQYLWDDGRVYLNNLDGSHHFVAARYIAKRINEKVPLRGRLKKYYFNKESNLLKSYQIFMLEKQRQVENSLLEQMESCRAEYGTFSLPQPYREDFHAIFLPNNGQHSAAIAKIMRDAGVFSLSDYFDRKIRRSNPAQ